MDTRERNHGHLDDRAEMLLHLSDLPKQAVVGERLERGGGWSRVQTKAGMKGCSSDSLEGTVSQQELSAATRLSTDTCHVGKCGSKISFLPGTEILGVLGQQCLLVQPETASAPAKAGAVLGPWARRE